MQRLKELEPVIDFYCDWDIVSQMSDADLEKMRDNFESAVKQLRLEAVSTPPRAAQTAKDIRPLPSGWNFKNAYRWLTSIKMVDRRGNPLFPPPDSEFLIQFLPNETKEKLEGQMIVEESEESEEVKKGLRWWEWHQALDSIARQMIERRMRSSETRNSDVTMEHRPATNQDGEPRHIFV